MSLDVELLKEAVQAEIDVAIKRFAAQKVAPLNLLVWGLLMAAETDEALRDQAIKAIGEVLAEARKTNGLDPDADSHVEMVLAMLKRRAVAKEYLQLARAHLGSTKAEKQ